MADPTAVVPYHDPFVSSYLETLFNFDDIVNPSISDLDAVSPIVSHLGDDGFIEDIIDPLDDPILWNFVNDSNPNDCEAGPSEIRRETINLDEDNLQNQYGNSVQVSIWPVPVAPFSCSCCQVLREIIHINNDHITKLEIHGRLGMICHAVLDNRPGGNVVPTGHKYHMFDFCKKSIENVKQFLVQYCEERKQAGYMLLHDPLSIYYEALCVGLDWDENLNIDDYLEQSPPHSGEECQGNRTEPERVQRTSLAAQRERTGKLTLNDLSNYFHIPIEAAAKQLNVCLTVVKKICRKHGLNRWPHRKVKSLEKQISMLRDRLNTTDIGGEKARIEAEIERIQREITDVCGGIPRG